MSKILDEMQVQLTGREYPKRTRMAHVNMSIESTAPEFMYKMLEYKITAEFGMRVKCMPTDLDPMRRSVFDTLKNEIYGEFIGRVLALECSIYEGDEDKSRMIIRDLLREVGHV